MYWNEYKSKLESKEAAKSNLTRFPLDVFFQGTNRLFVLAFNNTTENDNEVPASNTASRVQRDSHRKYFLPRVEITNYNVLIDATNFYDQPINDQIKKYNEIREIAAGKGDHYTTGCLLNYQYFKDHYQLIPSALSKQK